MAKKKKKSSTNKNQINVKHPRQSESTSSPATVLIAKNDTLQTKEGVALKSKMAAKSKIIRSNIKQGYFDSIVNLVQKDKVNLVTDFSKQSYSSSTMK